MADIKARVLFGQIPADATPTPFTVGGESRLPTACMIIATHVVAVDTDDTSLSSESKGMTDFVNTACCSASCRGSSQSSTTDQQHQSVDIINVLDEFGATVRTATITAVAGGIELTAGEAGSQFRIQIHLFFGIPATLINENALIPEFSTESYPHGLDVAPNAGIWMANGAFNAIANHSNISTGFHTFKSSVLHTLNLSAFHQDSVNPSITRMNLLEDQEILSVQFTNGADAQCLDLTVDNTNVNLIGSCSVDWSASNSICGLVFNVEDSDIDIRVLDAPINAGVDWDVVGVGFLPQYGYSLINTMSAFGANTSTNASCFSHCGYDEDGNVSSILTNKTAGTNGFVDALCHAGPRFYRTVSTGGVGHDMINPQFNADGFTIVAADIFNVSTTIRLWPTLFFEEAVDAVAGVLTNPLDDATGQTTSTGQVDTDSAVGTIFGVVTQSATTPTHAQIVAGQDEFGAPADAEDSAPAASFLNPLGPVPLAIVELTFTGLVDATVYFTHFTQDNGAESIPVSADGFTTSTNQPPVFDGPMPDQTVQIDIEMTPFDTSPFFSDPESETLTFSANQLPNGLSIDVDGLITGTPTGGFQP